MFFKIFLIFTIPLCSLLADVNEISIKNIEKQLKEKIDVENELFKKGFYDDMNYLKNQHKLLCQNDINNLNNWISDNTILSQKQKEEK